MGRTQGTGKNDMRITLIDIGATDEARLLRTLLEQLGAEIRLIRPGKPSDVFANLDFYGAPPDLVILSAHGDMDGLIFAEMAEGVDTLVLPGDRITPDVIAANADFAPVPVLSTACMSGIPEFAGAILKAGASAYVAPQGAPDGVDIPLFVHMLFHKAMVEEMTFAQAVERANAVISPQSAFILREGRGDLSSGSSTPARP